MTRDATSFPRLLTVRQRFPQSDPLDIPACVARELAKLRPVLRPGARIAVGVGSRGIRHLREIVQAVVGGLRAAGAHPFIVPAMGSHGGATPEGQKQLLADYGVTEASMQVPIDAAMETEQIGVTEDDVPVFLGRAAMGADGIVVVNRVKPHTDFRGRLGSGLLKMLAVGLGKRAGASTFHRAANRFGYEHVLRTAARVVLRSAPILGGVAVVEDHHHETGRLEALLPGDLESREEALFLEASRLLPKLPFGEADLLIVDLLGKNISGTGMDPNVVGRGVHGYSSYLKDRDGDQPAIRRLFARDLTPESHGNATGIGMADFTTTRLVESMDRRITTVNAITAMTPQASKIPLHFASDREVLTYAFDTLGVAPGIPPKVLRIMDTQNLQIVLVSEAYRDQILARPDLELLGEPQEMTFDPAGNLAPFPAGGP